MNKIQRRRLQKLPPMLRKVAEDQLGFHMHTVSFSRGTPACVLGHYASQPASVQRTFERHPKLGVSLMVSGICVGIAGQEVCNHFGLTIDEATELFDSNGCGNARDNPIAAAEYIENFIAEKG